MYKRHTMQVLLGLTVCFFHQILASTYEDIQKDLTFEQTLRVECQDKLKSKTAELAELQGQHDTTQKDFAKCRQDLLVRNYKMDLTVIEVDSLNTELEVLRGRMEEKEKLLANHKREARSTAEQLQSCNSDVHFDAECRKSKLGLINDLHQARLEKIDCERRFNWHKMNSNFTMMDVMVSVIVTFIVTISLMKTYDYMYRTPVTPSLAVATIAATICALKIYDSHIYRMGATNKGGRGGSAETRTNYRRADKRTADFNQDCVPGRSLAEMSDVDDEVPEPRLQPAGDNGVLTRTKIKKTKVKDTKEIIPETDDENRDSAESSDNDRTSEIDVGSMEEDDDNTGGDVISDGANDSPDSKYKENLSYVPIYTRSTGSVPSQPTPSVPIYTRSTNKQIYHEK